MSYPYQPAPTDLAYPWISQFDPTYQADFYVNTETGETTWQHPSSFAGQQSRDFSQNNNNGYDSSYQAPATSSYPASGAGEAASFYHSAPSTSSATGAYQGPSAQGPIPEDVQGGEGGERGLGKVVVMGGALWMAHKLYKDWQKNKLSSHQQSLLKPPQFAPSQQPPMGGYGQQYAPKAQAFNPQQVYSQPSVQQSWQQNSPSPAPSSYGQPQQSWAPGPAYGAPSYNNGPSDVYNVCQLLAISNRFGLTCIASQNNVPPPSFNGHSIGDQTRAAYNGYDNGYGNASTNAYNPPAYTGGWQQPQSHSGWGDPRY